MKHTPLVTKISQLLIGLLLISALTPVLAFAAAGFKDVTYDGRTVTGYVYYDSEPSDPVTVSVYTPDGVKLADLSAAFTVSDDTYRYYKFEQSDVTSNVYSFLELQESVSQSVYQAVYDVTPPEWPDGASLNASNIGRNSLRLNWSAAADNKGGSVTYHVYRNNSFLGTVTGDVYYNVTGLSQNTEYSFKVEASDELGNITADGPSVSAKTDRRSGGGGGGGGGGGFPILSNVIYAYNGTVSEYVLINSFEQYTNVEIIVQGDTLTLPVAALVEAAEISGATLTITNDNGSFILPLTAIDFNKLAATMEEEIDDLDLLISISEADASETEAVREAADALDGTLISDAVDFELSLEADDNSMDITSFDGYVKRKIPLSASVDKRHTTVALYDETTESLSFVPAVFEEDDNEWYALAQNKSNSIYVVATFDKNFDDADDHWAQEYIELLANKLVVEGTADSVFEPDRSITRAEFAALIVRALGLKQEAASGGFDDVSSGEWYANVVAAAANAGIVDGYEDGTFRPDANITREELAAMVVRAMSVAGESVNLSEDEQERLLERFDDASRIVWGEEEMAIAIDTGIVDGMTDTTLEPRDNATRAQSATMLKRLLDYVNFIN